MKFPDENDFFEAFGIEPVEVDSSLALCRYIKNQKIVNWKLMYRLVVLWGRFRLL